MNLFAPRCRCLAHYATMLCLPFFISHSNFSFAQVRSFRPQNNAREKSRHPSLQTLFPEHREALDCKKVVRNTVDIGTESDSQRLSVCALTEYSFVWFQVSIASERCAPRLTCARGEE